MQTDIVGSRQSLVSNILRGNEEVFRFDPQDTLVFRMVLRNKTDKEIRYKPHLEIVVIHHGRFAG